VRNFVVTGFAATLTTANPGAVIYDAGPTGYISDYGRGRIREEVGRLS
jgi:hypothetical protein